MPAVVRISSPVVTTRVVSSPYSYGYNYRYPYSYGYGYNYPYSYSSYYNYGYGYPLYNSVYSAPIYQAPIYTAPSTIVVAPPASSTTYGTCQATPSGVTSNSCAPGKVPISVAGQGCICADPSTGMGGCGNVLNGVCK